MKATFVAAVTAALVGSAAANHRRHGHNLFAHKRGTEVSTCVPGCTTIYETIYGEATLHNPKPTKKPTPSTTSKAPIDVPTPIPQVCPTPGTYTFPATTVTLTETTTVCAPTSTRVPSGTHTFGGVVTVVETATTVVCPIATVTTKNGVVTSVVETTTYVCPTPGTYTIAPITTVVVEETLIVYPTVTTYCPGTYTAPAVVTTVTETDIVVYCPFTSPTPEVKVTPTAAPTTPVKPSDTPKPGGSGDRWAITYTPYSSDSSGSCKSAGEVMSDIEKIKNSGFTTVRVYSTDCNTLKNVGDACSKYGLKMIIGVFIREAGCDYNIDYIKEQVTAITTWARWDLVELIVVGNECIFGGKCSASSLKTLIVTVKEKCAAAGYHGSFTTAETVNVWQQSDVKSELCGVVDLVGGQVHPYFNAETHPSDAGKFVAGQLTILEGICSGKPALSLECGWPSAGNCNGVACPGKAQQATAIASIKETCGSKVVFFSFHNDEWKDAGECGCEKSWGCGDLF